MSDARDVVRARVVAIQRNGILVQVHGETQNRLIDRSAVQARVTLPWKPRDLSHALIVLRRRNRLTDEYIDDLKVRKNFVMELLRCLSELGNWRANCGREPMHKYYTGFDWLDQDTIDELLPDSGIPETLKIEDLDDDALESGFTRAEFQDWLWEGRHDCDVAFAVLRLWTSTLRGNGNATL